MIATAGLTLLSIASIIPIAIIGGLSKGHFPAGALTLIAFLGVFTGIWLTAKVTWPRFREGLGMDE